MVIPQLVQDERIRIEANSNAVESLSRRFDRSG